MNYRIEDLGTLGGSSSEASDINGKGQIAGSSSIFLDGSRHAFLYDNGQMIDVGASLGAVESSAAAVNKSGIVVGRFTKNGSDRAFIYLAGVLIDLHPLLDGFRESWATGVNDLGDVVGNGRLFDPQTGDSSQSWLYSNGQGTNLNLNPLPAVSNAINISKQIAGTFPGLGGQHNQGFIYDSNLNELHLLPAFLGVDKEPWSEALAINDAGQVVGMAQGQNQINAFLYKGQQDPDHLTNLGDLTFVANDINKHGQVVGQTNNYPFLYDDGVVTNLNNVVPFDSGDWVLQTASAINDSGKIVGNGLHNGQLRAFLLSPVLKPQLPYETQRIEFFASEVKILFGVTHDGGGMIVLPDGIFEKIPPDPLPDKVYRALVRAMSDMLPGIAVRQIASGASNAKARAEIERGGLHLVEQAARQLLQSLESLKRKG